MKNFLYKAIAFSGPSNSGKTTLIEKLILALKDEYKILTIKHDPKDKAKFDVDGKDSDRFFKAGSDTIVLSPTRTTMFLHTPTKVEEIIKSFDFDFLFVEGLKEIDLPRISVFRGGFYKEYLPFSDALAIKDVDISKEYDIPIFDLDDINSIIKWIKNNAKVVK